MYSLVDAYYEILLSISCLEKMIIAWNWKQNKLQFDILMPWSQSNKIVRWHRLERRILVGDWTMVISKLILIMGIIYKVTKNILAFFTFCLKKWSLIRKCVMCRYWGHSWPMLVCCAQTSVTAQSGISSRCSGWEICPFLTNHVLDYEDMKEDNS